MGEELQPTTNGDLEKLASRAVREAAAGLWPIRRALTVAGVAAVLGLASLTVAMVLWITSANHSRALPVSELLDVLKLVLASVAGAGALFALVMAYRKQRLAEVAEVREQARAADDRTRVFNERFTAAAAQLGHDEPAVRLAGVYAMAGLADDWEHSRQTCIDVLCAYLQLPYNPDPGLKAGPERRLTFARDQKVRHTIINVIAAHLRHDIRTSWQGYDFDFSGVTFDGGNFTNVSFSGGKVSFEDAVFSDGTVSFNHASFSGGQISFRYAKFCGGTVSFYGAEFEGGRILFGFAKFTGGEVSFYETHFGGSEVNFFRSKFSAGKVDFTCSKLAEGTVAFIYAKFSGSKVIFDQAEFLGATVDLSNPESWAFPPDQGKISVTTPPSGLLLPPHSRRPVVLPGAPKRSSAAYVRSGRAPRAAAISASMMRTVPGRQDHARDAENQSDLSRTSTPVSCQAVWSRRPFRRNAALEMLAQLLRRKP